MSEHDFHFCSTTTASDSDAVCSQVFQAEAQLLGVSSESSATGLFLVPCPGELWALLVQAPVWGSTDWARE